MKIGIKLRYYPDSQLKQLIHQTAGNHRFIYNYYYNQNSSSKSQAELNNINNKEKNYPRVAVRLRLWRNVRLKLFKIIIPAISMKQ